MSRSLHAALCIVVATLVLSCNVFSPLTGASSDEDYLEEALACLHRDDFDCAIASYGKLSEGQKRNEKLCTALLAKGGFTLRAVITILAEKENKLLGNLAQILVPWNEDKSATADLAKITCGDFATNATEDEKSLGALLKTTSLLFHCATRIARSDQFQGTSDDVSAPCTTPGNRDGRITSDDIGASDGNVSASSPGMCAADARACVDDVLGIDLQALDDAGLVDLKGGVERAQQSFSDTTSLSQIRIGIASTIPGSRR